MLASESSRQEPKRFAQIKNSSSLFGLTIMQQGMACSEKFHDASLDNNRLERVDLDSHIQAES